MSTKTVADKAITFRIDSASKEQVILAKLAEVENDPGTKWLNRKDVFAPIRERFGYEL